MKEVNLRNQSFSEVMSVQTLINIKLCVKVRTKIGNENEIEWNRETLYSPIYLGKVCALSVWLLLIICNFLSVEV